MKLTVWHFYNFHLIEILYLLKNGSWNQFKIWSICSNVDFTKLLSKHIQCSGHAQCASVKKQKFTLTLIGKKIRQSNCFTKDITKLKNKELVWRNIFWWEQILHFTVWHDYLLITHSQCGVYEIFVSLEIYFVKSILQ